MSWQNYDGSGHDDGPFGFCHFDLHMATDGGITSRTGEGCGDSHGDGSGRWVFDSQEIPGTWTGNTLQGDLALEGGGINLFQVF